MDNVDNNIEQSIPSDLKERYIDFKFVGQGGMGRIISATDTSLDKRVGIKILPATVMSDTAIARFHQEAKAVSKLNHPHIIQVLDFGFASSGEPFLVMEFVKGETLDSVIDKQGKLPPRMAVKLAIQICSGLEHAHANGIVHRDLKPANIMLDENGQVKILDFGLAKVLDEGAVDWRLTKPGQAMGSPLYMSLEQLRGEEVDTRSDIYSLGLVIYKMVTGIVPFEDENLMKVVMGRMNEAPPALPANEDALLLTEALGAVVEVALQQEADDRFASMTELKEALQEVDSIPDPKKEEPEEKPNWFKTRILTKQFAAIVACIATAASFSLYYHLTRKPPTTDSASRRDGEGMVIKKDAELTIEKKHKGIPDGFELHEDKNGLWIGESRLVDADLKRLRGSGVEKLSLEVNKSITAEGIKIISGIPIKSLLLRETNLDDAAIPYLNKMKSLRSLNLRGTHVTDKGIEKFEIMPEVRYLDLGYLNDVTDASIPHIARAFPKLQTLVLKDTKVTGRGLKLLRPRKFYDLLLAGLKLTDEDMDTIVSFQPTRITLEDTLITDKGLDKLLQLPKLDHLSVEFCKDVSRKKLAEFEKKYPGIKITYPNLETDEFVDNMKTLKEPEQF